MMTTVATDIEGDRHLTKKKLSGTWTLACPLRSGNASLKVQKYLNTIWALKQDSDAIFIPNLTRVWFKQKELVPPTGTDLENCKAC